MRSELIKRIILVVKMKVLRGSGETKVSDEDVNEASQVSRDDECDKHLFDGQFEGFEDDQELFLIPKRSRKNKWAFVLRYIFYSLFTCAVLSTVYFLVDDFLDSAVAKRRQQESLNSFENNSSDLNSSINNQCLLPTGYGKFDCFPDASTASEEACLARGCCWIQLEPNSPAPWCFYPPEFSYYTWTGLNETSFGHTGQASLQNTFPSPYPDPVTELQVNVYYETENAVRVKIYDPKKSRFEVPLNYNASETKPEKVNYVVKGTPMGIQVTRKSGFHAVFDTGFAPIVFNDQFLEITTLLNTQFVYGLGEVIDTLGRETDWSRTVLFNHDVAPRKNTNLYSSHPFVLAVNQNGESHGILLLNSNAMEIILQQHAGSVAATFRTIGGILDFRIFVGPTPADVIRQYTNVIGKPFLPPYWSLGFHLCRFNYNSLNHTAQILENNIKAGIPIDVQWNDLDYMNNRNDFTYDPTKFKGLPEFVKSLHDRGMHYVPLIDPGVSAGEPAGSYPPYDEGIAADIFIKNHLGKPFVGKVWNRVSTAWPDFSHPNVTHYWMTQIDKFHNQVPIDGAWIDMNDPSNFWDGEKDGCPANSTLDHPPYTPHVDGGKLYYKTVCMSAQQYGGVHYNLHNLYGLQESVTTYKALGDIRSERPFVISRSSFPGQGHYGGSWTGDVFSTWEDLRLSIPQVLNYGLFGIPMVGADICGFNGNTTKDLCKRWQQLGAFYPFMRNHNTDDGIPQDPASLGQEVIDATKETLRVRYYLLPYIYSLFVHAHRTGEPVARPMFYEFPKDSNTFRMQNQFMLGHSILVAPILTPKFTDNSLDVYLPSGYWYSYYFQNVSTDSVGEGFVATVPNNSIPIFVKGGSIIVGQQPGQTTTESRKNKFEIKVYLSKAGNASGIFYWDDGVSNLPLTTGNYNQYNMTATNNNLRVAEDRFGYLDAVMMLGSIQVRGIRGKVVSVVMDNVDFKFTYNSEHKILELDNLNQTLKGGFSLNWKTAPF